jgi:uncharacterized protein (TIGR02996 family)
VSEPNSYLTDPEWVAALNARPGDFMTLLTYADWLAERGRVVEEEVLRWAAAMGRVPHYTADPGDDQMRGWWWGNIHAYGREIDRPDSIPDGLTLGSAQFQHLPPGRGRDVAFCYSRLAEGWANAMSVVRERMWQIARGRAVTVG